MTRSVSFVRATRPVDEIAEVLARSQTRKAAAAELGIPATTLERLCRQQALVALYEQLVERGAMQRGGGKLRGDKGRAASRKPVRRWSFLWRDPRFAGRDAVDIWPGKELEAVTEQEAIDVLMTVVPRDLVKREDVTAVEVCT